MKLATLFLATLLPAAAAAADLAALDAWIADAPPSAMARAAYVSVENTGEAPVGIAGASAEGFGMVQIHESRMQADGIMSMSPVDQIDLAPGQTLIMAPGGLHIMLMQAERKIARGDTITLTLELTDGTTLELDAIVRRPGES